MSVSYKDENGILQKGAGLYKSEVPIGIADIYTEGERQVGVFIDGKPVYQKTITFGAIAKNTTNYQVTLGLENVDKIVELEVTANSGNSYIKLPLPMLQSASIYAEYGINLQSYDKSTDKLRIDTGSDRAVDGGYVTVKYTKTTDTATGVLPKSASALYLMGDVEISNLQDGDVLKYDDDDNKWKNGVGGGGNANIWTGTQAELEEVFDELEEGTQINITDDEQEVVEGGTIYSEEEQIIGLWKDNRPIYQKSYVLTSSISVTSAWTNTGITLPSEVDRIINGEVYRNTSTGLFSASFNIDTSNHALRIRFASSETLDANSIITIQYTKSTDAPLDAVVGKKTMYIASSDCYSTEEKEIGCWVDGKPLYQKSFSILPTAQNFAVDVSSLNIEKLIDRQATISRAVNASTATQQKDAEYRTETNSNPAYGILCELRNESSIQIGIDGYLVSEITEIRLTIQYTKTTDTAGSGQYTPASGKAVHYSTDEQVIGTWIDGSTVYRRCYTLNTETGSFNANTWKEIPEIDTSNMRMALRVVGIPYDPSLPTVFVNYPLSGSTNRNAFNNHFAIMHYRNSAVNFTVGSIIIVEYTKLND